MTLKPTRDILAQYPQIELAYLYGSVARGTERDASDVDIAVYGKPLSSEQEDKLLLKLEKIYHRQVQLVQINRQTNPTFVHQILKYGEPLIVKDQHKKSLFETEFQLKYFDQQFLNKAAYQSTKSYLST